MEAEEARLAKLKEEAEALKNKELELTKSLSTEESLLKQVEKEVSKEKATVVIETERL